jgi:hypothetical protein
MPKLRLLRRLSGTSSRNFSTIALYTAGSTARSLVGGGGDGKEMEISNAKKR